jgi:hypothetical protein
VNSQALVKNFCSSPSAEPGQDSKRDLDRRSEGTAFAFLSGAQAPGQTDFGSGAEGAVIRFLHSFRVLLRSTRLYQRNHPRVLESLEAAERNLRAALAVQSPVAVGVEGGRLVVPALRGRALPDPRGEFSSLAEELSRSGITSLVFLPETNQGELDHLSRALNESLLEGGTPSHRAPRTGFNEAGGGDVLPVSSTATRATDSARLTRGDAAAARQKIRQDSPPTAMTAPASMVEQLEGRRIPGIRLNSPLERKLDTALASLVAALLAYGGTTPDQASERSAPQELPATAEELGATLILLAEIHRQLEQGQRVPHQEAARSLHATLSEAERRTVSLVVSAASHHPPHEEELPESYLARLAEGFVLEFALQEFRADRVLPPELQGLFARVCAAPAGDARRRGDSLDAGRGVSAGVSVSVGTPPLFARWGDEAHAERLFERFWTELPAREKSRVLRSPEAWCVPVTALRRYLEKLIEAGPEVSAGASSREARLVVLNYASCLESEQKSARRAVAGGLAELHPLLERLWPHQLPEELSRRVLRTLEHEASPGIAALLAATAENLARLSLEQGDYDGFERILEALEGSARDGEHAHLAALAKRLIADERWLGLVDAALFHWPRTPRGQEANRALDPVLSRLLRRDPERLLDRLGLLLTEPEGAGALPAMARLLRAVGEPALGALEARLLERRRQRTVAAIKLLAVVQPERLAAALSRVLPAWDWRLQDLAVSELARPAYQSLTPGAARAFLASLTRAHPMVVPMMLDQIGLAQLAEALPLLMQIAAGEHPRLRDVFIRIKAVEALGRMRAVEAAETLVGILERRHGFTHAEPAGLRAAAEEALALIDNRPSSARVRATFEALEKASLAFAHPRRYPRIPLTSPLSAQIEGSVMSFARGASVVPARVRTISLGGAFLESPRQLNVGDSIRVEIRAGLRSIQGTAVVRNVAPNGGGIEFVHMPQEDREKLRRLVRKLQRT